MTNEKKAILVAVLEEIEAEVLRFHNLIGERDATIAQAGLSVLSKEEKACIAHIEAAATLAREYLETI